MMFAEVCAATLERCRRKFFKANELIGAVFGACGSRDPRSEYEARAAAGWPQAAAHVGSVGEIWVENNPFDQRC
jgi:hypothetical protein